MDHGGGEPSLAFLIERSAELKRALVDFALSPRFERQLEQFMLKAADPYQELSEGEAIGVIDRFALHGEALMRRRKPWYYEHEPRPGISVIGARLSELVRQ
jgi:hypothetical protein